MVRRSEQSPLSVITPLSRLALMAPPHSCAVLAVNTLLETDTWLTSKTCRARAQEVRQGLGCCWELRGEGVCVCACVCVCECVYGGQGARRCRGLR